LYVDSYVDCEQPQRGDDLLAFDPSTATLRGRGPGVVERAELTGARPVQQCLE
jgi:hypothetical protein